MKKLTDKLLRNINKKKKSNNVLRKNDNLVFNNLKNSIVIIIHNLNIMNKNEENLMYEIYIHKSKSFIFKSVNQKCLCYKIFKFDLYLLFHNYSLRHQFTNTKSHCLL